MDEVDALRIRDEVLQAMYWMRSEGISEEPSLAELARCLAMTAAYLGDYMERLEHEGYLSFAPGGYRLTALGVEAGKRSFADEFADLTRSAHGECDENCWCHEDPDEAARCLEERASRAR